MALACCGVVSAEAIQDEQQANQSQDVQIAVGEQLVVVVKDRRAAALSAGSTEWQEYSNDGVESLTPFVIRDFAVLGVRGECVQELAGFSAKTGTWSRFKLEQPFSGTIGPTRGGVTPKLVYCRAGDQLIAYSGETGTWDAITTQSNPYWENKGFLIVKEDARVLVFSASTGRWQPLSFD